MNDFLYFCPTCKTIYEVVRHHVRPPTEPICERCQRDLPIAEEGDWLTYRRTRPRFERTGQLLTRGGTKDRGKYRQAAGAAAPKLATALFALVLGAMGNSRRIDPPNGKPHFVVASETPINADMRVSSFRQRMGMVNVHFFSAPTSRQFIAIGN